MGVSESKLEKNVVTFYTGKNFTGSSMMLSDATSLPNLQNANFSSLKIPSNFDIILFTNPYYEGEYRIFRGPTEISNLNELNPINSINLLESNKIGSLVIIENVDEKRKPDSQEAILTFRGRSGPESVLLKGPLNIPNIVQLGLPNNALISTKLGPNVILTAYDGANYTGEKIQVPSTGLMGTGDGRSISLQQLADRTSSFRLSLTDDLPSNNNLNTYSMWRWILFALFVLIFLFLLYLLFKSNNKSYY